MERHNVTVVDFGGKNKKKRPVWKIILFSLLALVLLTIITVISIFVLLPSLTDKEINRYVEPQGQEMSFSDVLGQIPLESISFAEGSELADALPGAAFRGVGLWEFNSLLRAGNRVLYLGEIASNTHSPTLDQPEIWQRMEIAAYKERVYLIKYFPSFYGPDNIACYEVIGGWEKIGVIDKLE